MDKRRINSAIIVFSFFFAGVSSLAAQSLAEIKGRVTNRSTGAALADANITLRGTRWSIATDTSGHYYLKRLQPGKYVIQAALIGFESVTIDPVILEPGKTHTVDFSLLPKALQLDSVSVEAERLWEKYQTDVSMVGIQRMKAQEITSVPGAFDDPTRAVLVRSGATGAGDFNSFLTIRGSSPEQNLVVMDGAVIPNPYRFRLAMGGGMSIFDPKTTQDVYLHLGGFTAEYGNALASVLEVNTRTGNLQRVKLGGAVNLTDAGVVIEGPLKKEKASFLLAARRTYLDLVAEKTNNSNSVYPYFYDFTNKWLWNLNEKNRLTLSLMASREQSKLSSVLAEAVNMTEGANMRHASLSWKRLLGVRGHLQTIISYYHDATAFRAYAPNDSLETSEYQNLNSQIDRLALQHNARYQLSPQNWLNFGGSGALVDSQISFRSFERNFYFARNDFPRDIRFDQSQKYYAAYVENTSELSRKFQVRIGVRYDYATSISEGELSHRLSILYKLNALTTLEGAWGDVYQYPDPLTLSIRDQPLEIGANLGVITAEKSTHKVLSIKRELPHAIMASLEFYHMDIDRLLLADDRETFEPFNEGRGLLQGMEVVIERRPSGAGGSSGLISYSFGRAQYHNIKNKKWIPFNYDRRHALTFWYNYGLGPHWQLSLLWRYAGGLPYTEVLGIQFTEYSGSKASWNFIRGPRNVKRFPAYQRLDARLSYVMRSANRSFSFYVDLINLLNHKNVYNLTWEKVPAPKKGAVSTLAKRRTIYMLPFLPSAGIQFWL